ncbi:MAG: phosphoenolpyruvate--protein phosphotransferase [Eubacteriales bacterium]|nr:phosphoenolpyruvate--protein phosphotransferase [Eubacteriales bacterium]
MEIFKGTSTFSGIAIGKIRYYQKKEGRISRYMAKDVKTELKSFRTARLKVLDKLRELYEGRRDEQEGELYLEQARALDGGSFVRAVESMIAGEKVSAAYAVSTTRDELTSTFRELEDPVFQKRIRDVAEVSLRLEEALGGMEPRISLGDTPVILAAESLSPVEIMEMNKDMLLAVVTRDGSELSHVSILARTMGIPSIVGISIDEDWEGEEAVVDGYTGSLYLRPSEELKLEYEIRRRSDMEEREELLKLKDERDETLDGREVHIYANISDLDDLGSAVYYGAAGIGLLRSEFQYLGKKERPKENDLFLAYKQMAEVMREKPAVVRVVDLGTDRTVNYLDFEDEPNPLMGNRGIRLLLDDRGILTDQLRAVYRASAYGNFAVLFPMISSLEEVEEILSIARGIREELTEKEIPFGPLKMGIMVETPAAVMISREIARRVDFLSLGTNDLTQYALAMDRQNPRLRKKYNDHHPAVLSMIRMVVEAGHAEGKPVGICGELAADTSMTGEFLRMGVDFLSVVPACILPLRKVLRSVDLKEETGGRLSL